MHAHVQNRCNEGSATDDSAVVCGEGGATPQACRPVRTRVPATDSPPLLTELQPHQGREERLGGHLVVDRVVDRQGHALPHVPAEQRERGAVAASGLTRAVPTGS